MFCSIRALSTPHRSCSDNLRYRLVMQSLPLHLKPCLSLLRRYSTIVRSTARKILRAERDGSYGSKLPAFSYYTSLRLKLGSRGFQNLSSNSSNIYALSTAPGRAAIAIVRISGPDCLKVVAHFLLGVISVNCHRSTKSFVLQRRT